MYDTSPIFPQLFDPSDKNKKNSTQRELFFPKSAIIFGVKIKIFFV